MPKIFYSFGFFDKKRRNSIIQEIELVAILAQYKSTTKPMKVCWSDIYLIDIICLEFELNINFSFRLSIF